MNPEINAVPYWLWAIELVVTAFFMFGYLTVYLNMTRHAFDEIGSHQRLWRMGLIPMTYCTGIALNVLGLYSLTYSLMFYSLAVFVFVFPITDEGISFIEYVFRALGIIMVGVIHHLPVIAMLQSVGFLALLVWVVAVYIVRSHVRHHLLINVLMNVVYAGLFWLTLPGSAFRSGDSQLTIEIQGILLYMIIATGVFYGWNGMSASRKKTQQITKIANYDTLTHAKSYSLYHKESAEMFATYRRTQKPLTMVELDVDHFKVVNDQYGHLLGNQVLILVVATLQDCLKYYGDEYQLYRTGGEEFMIGLPNTDLKQAVPVVRRCWEKVRQQVCHYDDQAVKITISLGVSQAIETDASIENVYKRADDSLYISKQNGRDTITVNGKSLQVKQETVTVSDDYAFFVQGIYDDTTDGEARIRNELTLHYHDRKTNKWRPIQQNELKNLSIDRLFRLLKEATVNLVLQRVQLPMSSQDFFNPEVSKRLTAFMRSADGPETLTVVLMRLSASAPLQNAVHSYRLAGIDVVLDVTKCDAEMYKTLDKTHPFDGLKYTLPSSDDLGIRARALLEAQKWHTQAMDWAIPIIIRGITTRSEVEWAQTQVKIHQLSGDFYGAPALPMIG
ncbi:GGDEF domain-containing protein [Secundilactobacillus collinoides]|uniref:GGDEF domain-containing protein n=1 Tax=Secundilactobacillus collinoides TaxID=33960 RepID=A0A166HNW3_SECCO|nr:GGDEF domain-containing protein [Secundilactobacillus collinoides]KZL42949.1 hypothetical protein TY91_02655 [Secundilactobacillus collinoides]